MSQRERWLAGSVPQDIGLRNIFPDRFSNGENADGRILTINYRGIFGQIDSGVVLDAKETEKSIAAALWLEEKGEPGEWWQAGGTTAFWGFVQAASAELMMGNQEGPLSTALGNNFLRLHHQSGLIFEKGAWRPVSDEQVKARIQTDTWPRLIFKINWITEGKATDGRKGIAMEVFFDLPIENAGRRLGKRSWLYLSDWLPDSVPDYSKFALELAYSNCVTVEITGTQIKSNGDKEKREKSVARRSEVRRMVEEEEAKAAALFIRPLKLLEELLITPSRLRSGIHLELLQEEEGQPRFGRPTRTKLWGAELKQITLWQLILYREIKKAEQKPQILTKGSL